MIIAERQDAILRLLQGKKYLSIGDICSQLHYSESTLRRDLKRMEKEGLLIQTRGGVSADTHPNMETPLAMRISANRQYKSAIAYEAAKMVEDNMMIMMDASTTAMEMVPYLRSKKNLTIITCCLSTAVLIAETLDCNLICTGGRYHAPTAALVGGSAETSLKDWFADMLFFSVNSIDAVNGLTDQGEEIVQLKKTMIQQSRKAVLLADRKKFGQTAAFRLRPGHLDAIVTNPSPDFDEPEWEEYRKIMVFSGPVES